MADAYPIRDLCAALDVSRAGFHAWRQRGPSQRDHADAALGERIGTLFARSRRTYGSPRLHRAWRRAGHACGRHRVARLMRARGFAGRVRGRRRPWTTDSDHARPIAPNRLGRLATSVERPNEGWVADMTYVPTDEGWLYLAGVLDLGSRRLVGWAMGETLGNGLAGGRVADGAESEAAQDGVAPPLRPRQPRCQRGVPRASGRLGREPKHEPPRQLLRQRGDGELLEHAQGGTRPIAPILKVVPRQRARSSITSRPFTIVSGSTALSAIGLLWNVKSRST